MKAIEEEIIKLPSGYSVTLSQNIYVTHFLNFDDAKEAIFFCMMECGHYFPHVIQSVFVLSMMCNGRSSFVDVFLGSLISGTCSMILWFALKMYRLPGFNTICSAIGEFVSKTKLNWVALLIIAFFVVKDWKAILYYILGSVVTSLVKVLLFTKLSCTKYNDEIAVKVSRFRT